MSTARRLRALRPTSTPKNRPPCGSSYSTRMCTRRMALATLVLVIYQGLFIDVITRSLYATGLKSIGIATQPLQSLPTCISLRHFLHPALPFYTLPSARAPRNTVSLYCPSSDCISFVCWPWIPTSRSHTAQLARAEIGAGPDGRVLGSARGNRECSA